MVAPAVSTALRINTDEVSSLLAALDAVLAAHRLLLPHRQRGVHYNGYRLITFMASVQPHAEYTLKLWAASHALEVAECVSRYDVAPYNRDEQIRSFSVIADGCLIAGVQFDPEPIPAEAAAPEVKP